MNSNNFVREYLSNNTTLKIIDVFVREGIVLDNIFLEGMVNELFAINADMDNMNPIGEAAKAFNHLKNTSGKVQKEIKRGNEETIKRAVVDLFSNNYSENIALTQYLNILNDTSVSELRFGVYKECKEMNHFGREAGFGSAHNYIIKRGSDSCIDLYFEKNNFDRGTLEETHCLSILLDDNYIKKIEPSKEIIKNLGVIEDKWSYPLQGESGYNYPNTERFAAAMVRYLPQLDWFKVSLMKGEFNTEMWTLFLSVLGKDSMINTGLKLFENYDRKKLRRITKIYEVPTGELSLIIGTDINKEPDGRNPDILFQYNYPNNAEARMRAHLKIEGARFYKDNTSENGLNIDKYMF